MPGGNGKRYLLLGNANADDEATIAYKITPIESRAGTAEAACDALVTAANEAGAPDNITVVVARLLPIAPSAATRRTASSNWRGGNQPSLTRVEQIPFQQRFFASSADCGATEFLVN